MFVIRPLCRSEMKPLIDPTTTRIRIPLAVLIVCLATLLFGVFDHALWTQDEPREAEIARRMAAGGSWLVPELAGVPFVEKPPLYYWFSAVAMLTLGRVTGETYAARAFSSLCAGLTLLLVAMAVKKYFSAICALSAVLVLATTGGFFYAGHWILIDPFLMALVTAAVLFFFIGLDRDEPLALLGGCLAAAGAFLAKGLVAWGLLAFPWLAALALNLSALRRRPLRLLAGLLVMILPAVAWAAVFRVFAGPELWNKWFWENQVGRFWGRTEHLGHIRGGDYYLFLLPLMLLPWTPALAGWFSRKGRNWWRDNPSGRRLLIVAAAWALGGFFLLCLAGTKRDIYLFPLLPGFAIIAAACLDDPPAGVKAALYAITLPLLLVLVMTAFSRAGWEEGKPALTLAFNPLLFLTAAAAIYLFIRYHRRPILSTASVTALFFITAVVWVVPVINRYKDYKPSTLRLAAAIPPEGRERVCGWDIDETTRAVFSYYAGLTVIDQRKGLPEEEMFERLQGLIDRKVGDCRYVLALIKRKRDFPPAGLLLSPDSVIAREGMGINRELLLIETGSGKWRQRQ